jgi:hypothetical protein
MAEAKPDQEEINQEVDADLKIILLGDSAVCVS